MKLRLGFLTQGYEDKYYYWEIVLLLRKTVLVLMLTFLAPISAGIQSLSAILLLIFSLIFHMNKQPFYDYRLNYLETTSLFVQIAIIYFGLYYQAGKNDQFVNSDGMMYTFFLIIVICSAQFIALFFFRMRLEMLKATVEKHSLCFRILSCGRIKDKEAFKKDHRVNQLENDEILQSQIERNRVLPKSSKRTPRSDEIVDPKHVKVKVSQRDQDMLE